MCIRFEFDGGKKTLEKELEERRRKNRFEACARVCKSAGNQDVRTREQVGRVRGGGRGGGGWRGAAGAGGGAAERGDPTTAEREDDAQATAAEDEAQAQAAGRGRALLSGAPAAALIFFSSSLPSLFSCCCRLSRQPSPISHTFSSSTPFTILFVCFTPPK